MHKNIICMFLFVINSECLATHRPPLYVYYSKCKFCLLLQTNKWKLMSGNPQDAVDRAGLVLNPKH